MRLTIIVCLFVWIAFCSIPTLGKTQGKGAQTDISATPIGRWKTVDDVTGKATSVVTIFEENGKLYGRIEKLIDPDPLDRDPRCNRCDGDAKGRPLIGLEILWGLRRDGAQWSGGRILDPETGKTYKCVVALEDGGAELKVRGFIGFSILGRTQYWTREK